MAKKKKMTSMATRVIHAGQQADPTTGAVMQPIYQTSTYLQPGLGEGWKYDYARTINPTRSALERKLADLEGGADARCFASGMAATAAVMHLLESGDHVVVSHNVYGGTHRLFEGLLRQFGLDFSWVDTSDVKKTAAAITPKTRMLFIETPTNPLLQLTDLAKTARLAKKHGLTMVVDNTFMSPVFQRPLEHGADLVIHSTTKYLNGHSDSVGGCVVAADKAVGERLGFIQKSVGAILGPQDSFLVLRGLKTLVLRMERHDVSGRAVAEWLTARRKVKQVFYPGLKDHPQHRLARRQMDGFGGMVTFDLGSYPRAKKFLGRVKLCSLAESLGGVETLISHPATMTHAWLSKQQRRKIGVGDGLVRISVGVEGVDDILADLGEALKGV